ncbi:MAG: hypothetical protein WAL29_03465 [Bacteroidales bacterium]
MGINNVKHTIGDLDGVRCTIVESGVTIDRAAFLTDLLGFNNLEVKEMILPPENEGDSPRYTIGVTDIVFNPVFAIYERRLKTREGALVTPAYWKQECTECDPKYWVRRKKSK